jgi:tRNA (guanine-N7-)-methyltransferase
MNTSGVGLCATAGAVYSEELRARRDRLGQLLESFYPPGHSVDLTVEVGCGHGHFLTAYASEFPGEAIGIDICRERVERAKRKRERAALPNVRFVRGEAEDFFAVSPPWLAIRRIFILFPDPWAKRRHHKKRFFNRAFLDLAAEKCAPGADLFFRSDHLGYCDAAQKLLQQHEAWEFVPDGEWPFEYETVFQRRASIFRSLMARRW